MAARGKYENLPGIDNQQDVFETPDVVTDEDKSSQNDDADENVEVLSVDTNQAFNRFQGKYLDSSGIDFSDGIGLRKIKGYRTRSEYEIIGDASEKETPEQKYQRLQHEMRELAEELDQIKGTVQDEEEEKKLSPVALAQEVKILQQQLHDLHLEKVLGKKVLESSSSPQGGLSQRLQTQLEAFKSHESIKAKPPSKSDFVTYELYYKPEHAKFNQVSQLSALENRVQTLEKVLGHDTDMVSSITADLEIKEKSLLSAVSAIQSKIALLDANHIEHIDARLQGVLHHVSQISEKKNEVENAAKQSKVSQLYDQLNKWDTVVDVVPDVIDRLHSLKALHQQASHFGQTLVQLDKAQQDVSNQLHTQGSLLKEVEGNFKTNLSAIEENCSKIDARIAALLAKVDKR
ncbi:predicted protein [Nematostella vectensis]|uniref:Dynactin subunit 2 n=1 Tax=Nematostella vectensis TaxID=45351 RepID=A7S251_NEMVE|nr:dynactin subunit 2 [Nematostella vectensis]EDO42225.1 predicted protein [Nematostella vectensis]|eukprot:XP_001634288.1 predicted protein [Nematostella vectensis]